MDDTIETGGFRGSAGKIGIALIGGAVIAGGGYLALRPHGGPGLLSTVEGPKTPPPPPPWTQPQLQDLLGAIDKADAEGLQAKDYQHDALKAAIDSARTGPDTDKLAAKAAVSLAHDFAEGRIRRRSRFNWYIENDGPNDAALAKMVDTAREDGKLGSWLTGLLPTDPQYAALRNALAATSADATDRRGRIKANMERWRWLPRDFGAGDQLYVNLPTYELEVRENGQTSAHYTAVIGATDMPTPTLSAPVKLVIVNPSWIVPMSIVRKSHLKPGGKYTFTTLPNGTLRVKQKPGAGNALGKVKIEFPNKLAIYFHDTPSRSLFGASVRAFSHGCVRVQNIDQLGSFLMNQSPRFTEAMAGDKTRGFTPIKQWRANIVYFTMVSKPGEGLTEVGDPYKMDDALAAALEGRKPKKPVTLTPPPPVIGQIQAGVKTSPLMPVPVVSDPDTKRLNEASAKASAPKPASPAPEPAPTNSQQT